MRRLRSALLRCVILTQLLCVTLAKGEEEPPIPARPPRGYSAEFHIHVEHDGGTIQRTETSSVVAGGFLPALEKVRQIFITAPDERGKTSADLILIGPKSRYYTYGSGDSLHHAIEDATRQAKEHLKTALADGDGPPMKPLMGPPIPTTPPPPRGYSAEFKKGRVRNEGSTTLFGATPGTDDRGFFPALGKARKFLLDAPDRKGEASVELEMIGPRSRYSCSGGCDPKKR